MAVKMKSTKVDPLNFEFHEIDKYRLDEEWVQQEKIVHAFALEMAEAKRELENAKLSLDLSEAKMDKKIRANPERYKLQRLTEGSIAKEVILQLAKGSELQAVIEAKYKIAVLSAGLERLSARGKAITDLVHLHSVDYFAEPKVPKGIDKEAFDRIKNRKAKVREK